MRYKSAVILIVIFCAVGILVGVIGTTTFSGATADAPRSRCASQQLVSKTVERLLATEGYEALEEAGQVFENPGASPQQEARANEQLGKAKGITAALEYMREE
jgi:hypothetical protein